MNKVIGIQLTVYSLLLAGLSYLVHYLDPAIARPTLITGLAGGVLCLAWAVRAVLGKRGKALPILTLIPICYILLGQMIMIWTGPNAGLPGRQPAAAVVAVLFLLSLGMLVRIAYAGMTFGGVPPNPTKDAPPKPQASGKSAARSHAFKTA